MVRRILKLASSAGIAVAAAVFSVPAFAIAILSASPTEIDEDQTATLTITFESSPDGWSATFNSGEGETASLNNASGTNSVVFTYENPGIFRPTAVGTMAFNFLETVTEILPDGSTRTFTRVVTRFEQFAASVPVTVNAVSSAVPEPGTLALVGLLLAALGFGRARRWIKLASWSAHCLRLPLPAPPGVRAGLTPFTSTPRRAPS